MRVLVSDTLTEAEAYQRLMLADYLLDKNDTKLSDMTKRWATPKLRLDGSWSIPLYNGFNAAGLLVKEYSGEDYPSEET